MKILIINTLYSPNKIGGAEVSTQILAESLVKSGYSTRVLTLTKCKFRHSDVINGVEVIYLPLKNIYWPYDNEKSQNIFIKLFWHIIDLYNPFMRRQVKKEILDFSPDVVHSNNIQGFSVSVWCEVFKRKVKLVHTIRDYYLFHPNSTLFKDNKNMKFNCVEVLFWSFIKKFFLKKVDVLVGISNFMLNAHLENGFFCKKTSVIYNPIVIPVINSKEGNGNIICPKVGYIGRLTNDKGFDKFCDIAEENPEFSFCAAGRFNNDEDGQKLRARAVALGIKLLGFTELSEFLKNVDVVILPLKWREPFGRVVVECCLAKKIVFTNQVGGVSEISKMFPKQVFDILDFPGKLQGIKNLDFSLDKEDVFSEGACVKKYIDIYNSFRDSRL